MGCIADNFGVPIDVRYKFDDLVRLYGIVTGEKVMSI